MKDVILYVPLPVFNCHLPACASPISDSVAEDKMQAEGVSRFLVDDLGMDPESRSVLVLAWKFKAETQCEFKRTEFVEGMATLG